jgi:hypothetical protein
MNREEITQSIDKPAGMSAEDELAWALAGLLRWPLPGGRDIAALLPGWLIDHARDALTRYRDCA